MSEKSKYENRNPLHQYLLRRFLTAATNAFIATRRRKVVEIGCADGYVYEFLRAHSGIDFDYRGYDIDESALAQARVRFPGTRFMQGSIYDLEVESDVILCMEVLEHLTTPGDALKRLSAMHADYFIVSVPHEPWFKLGNLVRGGMSGR